MKEDGESMYDGEVQSIPVLEEDCEEIWLML
jgi:hypothetical protein